MKKNILFVAILATSLSFGQNTFPASGNVGIGTTFPIQKLTVDTRQASLNAGVPANFGTNQNGIMRLQVDGNSWGETLDFGMNVVPTYAWLQATNRGNLSVNYNLSLNPNGGNIGIGTASPFSKLTIGGALSASTSQISIVNNEGGHAIIRSGITGVTNQGISFLTANIDGSNQKNTMVISADNNVGIGTTSPDAKLTVNGNIHAKEVKIDLSILAPDYVFASNYKLKTLKEVEAYINKNNHLPEIPSAKEFEKNGILLAEMNMNLLKKVEELTLYLIELNKKMEIQQKENMAQSAAIEILKK